VPWLAGRWLLRVETEFGHQLLAGSRKIVLMALEAFGLEQFLVRGRTQVGAEFVHVVTANPEHRMKSSVGTSVAFVATTMAVGFGQGGSEQTRY